MSFAIGAHGTYPEASKSFFISNKRLLLHTEFACIEDDDDNVAWSLFKFIMAPPHDDATTLSTCSLI